MMLAMAMMLAMVMVTISMLSSVNSHRLQHQEMEIVIDGQKTEKSRSISLSAVELSRLPQRPIRPLV
jgi:hypothetical protein